MGHVGFQALAKTLEIVTGVTPKPCALFLDCNICREVKSKTAAVAKQSLRQTKRPLELVHMDVTGPYPNSLAQNRFSLCLVDDHSRFCWIFPIRRKSDVFATVKAWAKRVEKQLDLTLKAIQTDRGGEFLSTQFQTWLKRQGIEQRLANVMAPAENGVAERKNAVLKGTMMALIRDAGVSNALWAEAIKVAAYLTNRTWTSSIQDIPYRVMYGKAPDLRHLRLFGCKAWVNVPLKKRRCMQKRARRLTFLGYQPGCKSYRFLGDGTEVVLSRSAGFQEDVGWDKLHGNDVPGSVLLPVSDAATGEQAGQEGPKTPIKPKSPKKEEAGTGGEIQTPQSPAQQVAQSPPPVEEPRRSQRSTKGIPPERYGVQCSLVSVKEPEDYWEVCNLPAAEKAKWQAAMSEEIDSLLAHGVCEPVVPPADSKVVGCRWVYKIKPTDDGGQYKARLVARGFSQQKFTHYDELFSPTVKPESFRTALAVAGSRQWVAVQYDIKTAYLNAPLREVIYMDQIPGYHMGPQGTKLRLKKALYGLKQSAREWNRCIDSALKGLSFQQSLADPCLYTVENEHGKAILLLFVDDLCLLAENTNVVEWFQGKLQEKFQLRCLGTLKHHLGVPSDKNLADVYMGNLDTGKLMGFCETVFGNSMGRSESMLGPVRTYV